MSEALLREIAEKIAREQFLAQWPIYLLMLSMVFVVGTVAAYIGSYAKRRGENFATKADFADLIFQLKETTAAAEVVKTKISHADWSTREMKTLRRLKLEELLLSVYELKAWQDVEMGVRIYNSGKETMPSPLPKVELLTSLYFSEIESLIHEFTQLHSQLIILTLETHEELLKTANNDIAQRDKRNQFGQNWMLCYQKQLKAISAIEKQCRVLMAELVGV